VAAEPLARLDYAEIVDDASWEQPAAAAADSLLVIAAHLGQTRLIDNMHLGGEDEP
jgi:pantoate--beta-alanine ligase